MLTYYEAAIFSKLAYVPNDDPAALTESLSLLQASWERITFFEHDNGFGVSVFNNHRDGKTVVAFRGTHNLANLISDAQLLLQWSLSVADQAKAFYDEHKTNHLENVIFTGHSLGAALAASMSLDYGVL